MRILLLTIVFVLVAGVCWGGSVTIYDACDYSRVKIIYPKGSIGENETQKIDTTCIYCHEKEPKYVTFIDHPFRPSYGGSGYILEYEETE